MGKWPCSVTLSRVAEERDRLAISVARLGPTLGLEGEVTEVAAVNALGPPVADRAMDLERGVERRVRLRRNGRSPGGSERGSRARNHRGAAPLLFAEQGERVVIGGGLGLDEDGLSLVEERERELGGGHRLTAPVTDRAKLLDRFCVVARRDVGVSLPGRDAAATQEDVGVELREPDVARHPGCGLEVSARVVRPVGVGEQERELGESEAFVEARASGSRDLESALEREEALGEAAAQHVTEAAGVERPRDELCVDRRRRRADRRVQAPARTAPTSSLIRAEEHRLEEKQRPKRGVDVGVGDRPASEGALGGDGEVVGFTEDARPRPAREGRARRSEEEALVSRRRLARGRLARGASPRRTHGCSRSSR